MRLCRSSSACLFALGIIATWLTVAAIARADEPWKAGSFDKGRIDLTRGADVFEITFPRDNIVEFNFQPGGKSGPPTPVLAKREGSVLKVDSPLNSEDGMATLSTAGVKVEVAAAPLDVKISDSSGKLLCELSDWSADGCTVRHDHHHFLGSEETVKAGQQGYNGGPFVWTTSGYGLLWDSDGGTVKREETQLTIRRNAGTDYPRPDFDCYLIVGPPRAILEGLADLSGHAPMFPKWNLGFMVTRWGVKDQQEIVDNVHTFREKKIPFDTYIIDYDWFLYGRGDWGDFEWDPKFPDGASGKFCKDILASQGVKMCGIRKPRLGGLTPGKAIDEAMSHGWIDVQKNGTKEFNFHIKAASDWWWEHTKPLFESGIAGFWNDEADYNGNFHFLEMQRCQYEGQRSISNQRVWSLDRNFYTGSQRYAYALWSGDIGSGFKSMGEQRARMMQSINGGELWWSMDTGGFHDNPTPENYARWIEFATFVPIMRVHGAIPAKREPWNYGPQAEAVAKKYIELRYHLLPYLYSGAWQITKHGLPLARPMWLDYSDDPQVTESMTDEWMVGDYLLVRPVVDEGATSTKIYLPAGTWIDYWTGESHPGNQWIERAADAKNWDDLPLYIKRGAIIPTAPPMLYVGQTPIDPLTVEVYPDTKGSHFAYYDDDGETYDYEKKVYAEMPMDTAKIANGMIFETGDVEGSFPLPTHTLVVKFHLLDEKRIPGKVTVSGRQLEQVASPAVLDAKDEGWTLTSDASGAIVEVRYKIEPGPHEELRPYRQVVEVTYH